MLLLFRVSAGLADLDRGPVARGDVNAPLAVVAAQLEYAALDFPLGFVVVVGFLPVGVCEFERHVDGYPHSRLLSPTAIGPRRTACTRGGRAARQWRSPTLTFRPAPRSGPAAWIERTPRRRRPGRHRRARPTSTSSPACSAASSARASAGSSAPTSTPTTATPTATSSTSSRAASACPTSPTTARTKFAEIRAEVRRLPEPACSRSPAAPTPDGAAAAACMALETRLAAGPLGARRDPRRAARPTTSRPLDELRGAAPGASTGRAGSRALGGRRRDARRGRSCASRRYLAAPLDGPRRGPARGLEGLARRSASSRTAAPYLTAAFVESNFDFYGRTLTGTPELRDRWKRGVGARRGRDRRGASASEYVARHFPPAAKAHDGRAGRQPARGLPPVSIAALDWMSEETKQRALRQARHVPAQDRLPRRSCRDYSRARDQRRRPARQRARGRGVRDRPRARARSARRSTATSGSCCRRPSTPTTTRA